MAVHFHPLRVTEVRKETSDCVSVLFEVPPALKETFAFTQGQNITLRTTIDGEEVRRSYSICSAPFENQLRVAIKKVNGGLFSTYANTQLQPGDVLEVLPPTGRFFVPLQAGNQQQYVAFAAGSGITPVISIIKTTLQTEPNSHFTLVYGNRSRASIVFFEALEALKNKYVQRFTFINILSREKTDAPVNFGRINTEKLHALEKLIPCSTAAAFFVCGPEEMIFCVKDFLEQAGVEKGKIHFELFASPGQKKKTVAKETVADDSGPKSNITIQLDGRSFSFQLPFSSELSILDAALQQGADLPFACKGGVCCTCRARLTQGEVDMDVNYALEHEEVEQGYILTCQSHPKTETVVIDFDVK
jgi:ring-1,2-phenylacetyl-CoA epoxidase subunit PaaE